MALSKRELGVGSNGRLLLWGLLLFVFLIGLMVSVACRDETEQVVTETPQSEPNQPDRDAPAAESNEASSDATAEEIEQVEIIGSQQDNVAEEVDASEQVRGGIGTDEQVQQVQQTDQPGQTDPGELGDTLSYECAAAINASSYLYQMRVGLQLARLTLEEIEASRLKDPAVLESVYHSLSAKRSVAIRAGVFRPSGSQDGQGLDGAEIEALLYDLGQLLYHNAQSWNPPEVHRAKALAEDLLGQMDLLIEQWGGHCSGDAVIAGYGLTAQLRSQLLALSGLLDAAVVDSCIAWDCLGHGYPPESAEGRLWLEVSLLKIRATIIELRQTEREAIEWVGPFWEQRIHPAFRTLDRVISHWVRLVENKLAPEAERWPAGSGIDVVTVELAIEAYRAVLVAMPTGSG